MKLVICEKEEDVEQVKKFPMLKYKVLPNRKPLYVVNKIENKENLPRKFEEKKNQIIDKRAQTLI